ncbi:GrpB family protein [Nonomuraea typhae]|uniref:GrpB family protein n=1 Tax=Nonomuraea typhae TaxID=2603600 RepID=UPI0012F92DCE|nr:GrpB family protein [Nonomuraea typhae]
MTPSDRPVVVPYDPAWQEDAAALCAGIRDALGPLALHVEHIGSTSIPGMAAKPIFDVQVSVADLDAAEKAFGGPLEALGFGLSRYRRDHVPEGQADEPGRWAKRLWVRPGRVNLHVRVAGAPNDRLALLFRDWFRAHPEAVPAYAEFKRRLAGVAGGTGAYADTKDPVVDLVIVVAERWAGATGWSPH